MRRFRLSIFWLMFVVSLLAVNFALLRAPGGRDDVSLIKITGLIFMADILAIGLFRLLTRRGESHARLVRFEISGLVVVLFYVLCHSLSFFEPIRVALDGLIGFIDSRLIILFWHPLSDFDRGDPFGRLLTYAIVIMFPAILLTVLLVALASIGPLLHRRAD
jgi:hypothetical protein